MSSHPKLRIVSGRLRTNHALRWIDDERSRTKYYLHPLTSVSLLLTTTTPPLAAQDNHAAVEDSVLVLGYVDEAIRHTNVVYVEAATHSGDATVTISFVRGSTTLCFPAIASRAAMVFLAMYLNVGDSQFTPDAAERLFSSGLLLPDAPLLRCRQFSDVPRLLVRLKFLLPPSVMPPPPCPIPEVTLVQTVDQEYPCYVLPLTRVLDFAASASFTQPMELVANCHGDALLSQLMEWAAAAVSPCVVDATQVLRTERFIAVRTASSRRLLVPAPTARHRLLQVVPADAGVLASELLLAVTKCEHRRCESPIVRNARFPLAAASLEVLDPSMFSYEGPSLIAAMASCLDAPTIKCLRDLREVITGSGELIHGDGDTFAVVISGCAVPFSIRLRPSTPPNTPTDDDNVMVRMFSTQSIASNDEHLRMLSSDLIPDLAELEAQPGFPNGPNVEIEADLDEPARLLIHLSGSPTSRLTIVEAVCWLRLGLLSSEVVHALTKPFLALDCSGVLCTAANLRHMRCWLYLLTSYSDIDGWGVVKKRLKGIVNAWFKFPYASGQPDEWRKFVIACLETGWFDFAKLPSSACNVVKGFVQQKLSEAWNAGPNPTQRLWTTSFTALHRVLPSSRTWVWSGDAATLVSIATDTNFRGPFTWSALVGVVTYWSWTDVDVDMQAELLSALRTYVPLMSMRTFAEFPFEKLCESVADGGHPVFAEAFQRGAAWFTPDAPMRLRVVLSALASCVVANVSSTSDLPSNVSLVSLLPRAVALLLERTKVPIPAVHFLRMPVAMHAMSVDDRGNMCCNALYQPTMANLVAPRLLHDLAASTNASSPTNVTVVVPVVARPTHVQERYFKSLLRIRGTKTLKALNADSATHASFRAFIESILCVDRDDAEQLGLLRVLKHNVCITDGWDEEFRYDCGVDDTVVNTQDRRWQGVLHDAPVSIADIPLACRAELLRLLEGLSRYDPASWSFDFANARGCAERALLDRRAVVLRCLLGNCGKSYSDITDSMQGRFGELCDTWTLRTRGLSEIPSDDEKLALLLGYAWGTTSLLQALEKDNDEVSGSLLALWLFCPQESRNNAVSAWMARAGNRCDLFLRELQLRVDTAFEMATPAATALDQLLELRSKVQRVSLSDQETSDAIDGFVTEQVRERRPPSDAAITRFLRLFFNDLPATDATSQVDEPSQCPLRFFLIGGGAPTINFTLPSVRWLLQNRNPTDPHRCWCGAEVPNRASLIIHINVTHSGVDGSEGRCNVDVQLPRVLERVERFRPRNLEVVGESSNVAPSMSGVRWSTITSFPSSASTSKDSLIKHITDVRNKHAKVNLPLYSTGGTSLFFFDGVVGLRQYTTLDTLTPGYVAACHERLTKTRDHAFLLPDVLCTTTSGECWALETVCPLGDLRAIITATPADVMSTGLRNRLFQVLRVVPMLHEQMKLLHSWGFAHGALSPSKIMLTEWTPSFFKVGIRISAGSFGPHDAPVSRPVTAPVVYSYSPNATRLENDIYAVGLITVQLVAPLLFRAEDAGEVLGSWEREALGMWHARGLRLMDTRSWSDVPAWSSGTVEADVLHRPGETVGLTEGKDELAASDDGAPELADVTRDATTPNASRTVADLWIFAMRLALAKRKINFHVLPFADLLPSMSESPRTAPSSLRTVVTLRGLLLDYGTPSTAVAIGMRRQWLDGRGVTTPAGAFDVRVPFVSGKRELYTFVTCCARTFGLTDELRRAVFLRVEASFPSFHLPTDLSDCMARVSTALASMQQHQFCLAHPVVCSAARCAPGDLLLWDTTAAGDFSMPYEETELQDNKAVDSLSYWQTSVIEAISVTAPGVVCVTVVDLVALPGDATYDGDDVENVGPMHSFIFSRYPPTTRRLRFALNSDRVRGFKPRDSVTTSGPTEYLAFAPAMLEHQAPEQQRQLLLQAYLCERVSVPPIVDPKAVLEVSEALLRNRTMTRCVVPDAVPLHSAQLYATICVNKPFLALFHAHVTEGSLEALRDMDSLIAKFSLHAHCRVRLVWNRCLRKREDAKPSPAVMMTYPAPADEAARDVGGEEANGLQSLGYLPPVERLPSLLRDVMSTALGTDTEGRLVELTTLLCTLLGVPRHSETDDLIALDDDALISHLIIQHSTRAYALSTDEMASRWSNAVIDTSKALFTTTDRVSDIVKRFVQSLSERLGLRNAQTADLRIGEPHPQNTLTHSQLEAAFSALRARPPRLPAEQLQRVKARATEFVLQHFIRPLRPGPVLGARGEGVRVAAVHTLVGGATSGGAGFCRLSERRWELHTARHNVATRELAQGPQASVVVVEGASQVPLVIVYEVRIDRDRDFDNSGNLRDHVCVADFVALPQLFNVLDDTCDHHKKLFHEANRLLQFAPHPGAVAFSLGYPLTCPTLRFVYHWRPSESQEQCLTNHRNIWLPNAIDEELHFAVSGPGHSGSLVFDSNFDPVGIVTQAYPIPDDDPHKKCLRHEGVVVVPLQRPPPTPPDVLRALPPPRA